MQQEAFSFGIPAYADARNRTLTGPPRCGSFAIEAPAAVSGEIDLAYLRSLERGLGARIGAPVRGAPDA